MKPFDMAKQAVLLFLAGFLWATAAQAEGQAKTLAVADGSLTEIVYALGAQDRLLAVDSSSTYPEAATRLPDIGYMRQLSAEGVLSVMPHLLLTTTSAGPAPVLDKIRQAGVEVVVVDNIYTVEGLAAKIRSVAGYLGKEAAGKALQQQIDSQLVPLQAAIDGTLAVQGKPSVLFFMGMQGNQLMAAGGGTQADAMINILHGTNLLAAQASYKPLAQEALLALDPDVIVVASDLRTADPEAVKAQFQRTRAYRNGRILLADMTMLLGFGPRLPEALKLMAGVMYPGQRQ